MALSENRVPAHPLVYHYFSYSMAMIIFFLIMLRYKHATHIVGYTSQYTYHIFLVISCQKKPLYPRFCCLKPIVVWRPSWECWHILGLLPTDRKKGARTSQVSWETANMYQ